MKRFYKTLGGKLFLFLITTICVAAVMAAGVGTVFMLETGYPVYTRSEQETLESHLLEQMYYEGMDLMPGMTCNPEKTQINQVFRSNLAYKLYNEDGKLLAKSSNVEEIELKSENGPVWQGISYNVVIQNNKVVKVGVSVEDNYMETSLIAGEEHRGMFTDMVPTAVEEEVYEEEAEELDEDEEAPEEIVEEEEPEADKATASDEENAASKKTTKTEQAESNNKVDKTETAESNNKVDKTETAENTDKVDKTEKTDKTAETPAEPEIISTTYTMQMTLAEGLPYDDYYHDLQDRIHMAYQIRYLVPILGSVCFFLGLLCWILLLFGAGWKIEDGEPVLTTGAIEKIPFDLLLVLWGFGDICLAAMFFEAGNINSFVIIPWAVVTFLFVVPGFIGLSMDCLARIKNGTLWNNSILRKCWLLIRRIILSPLKKLFLLLVNLFKNMPVFWRTALILAAIVLIEFFGIVFTMYDRELLYFLWFMEKALQVPLVLAIVLNLRKLEASAKALADGDLFHRTETDKLFPGIRQSGENLNRIGMGMAKAVEERLKSERMKTELITNVSHDIKTPLTSVINYADLISKNPEDAELVKEYSEVLVRQSDRLKRLLEDLVEASKASTGNLEVDMVPCDANIFLNQIAGEYEEKIQQCGLSLIQKGPGKELIINADGRRMWRLFANLLNNICKYSLPGSRVYLTLEEKDGKAVFSFKNTSREPLNLTEEELFERFTRGDASRHTEGSGLGLAIAKSMADLQGGDLHLVTDGDLFKAVAEFPLV